MKNLRWYIKYKDRHRLNDTIPDAMKILFWALVLIWIYLFYRHIQMVACLDTNVGNEFDFFSQWNTSTRIIFAFIEENVFRICTINFLYGKTVPHAKLNVIESKKEAYRLDLLSSYYSTFLGYKSPFIWNSLNCNYV